MDTILDMKYNIGDQVGKYGVWKGTSRGKYDIRNKINNLTGKEWIQNTASVWEYEDDSMTNLCEDIIGMFTKNTINNNILIINDTSNIITQKLVDKVYSKLGEKKPSFHIEKFKNSEIINIDQSNSYQLTISFINKSLLSDYSHLSIKQQIEEFNKLFNCAKANFPNFLYSVTQKGRYSVVVLNEPNINGTKISISSKIIKSYQCAGFEYRGKITSFDRASMKKLKDHNDYHNIVDIHTYILIFYKPKKEFKSISNELVIKSTNIIQYNKTKSIKRPMLSVLYSKTKTDPIGKIHPATFSYIDVEYLIKQFIGKNKNKIIFDPFLGVASTIIASHLTGNIGIGIELNTEYIELSEKRLQQMNINNYITVLNNEIIEFRDKNHYLIEGDSINRINQKDIPMFDYCITSPPYHNILRNNGNGVRSDNSQFRQGVEYYSELENDLGNLNSFEKYLELLSKVMTATFNKLKNNGYCSIVISDFTVDKREMDVSGAIVQLMCDIGYEYIGTIILFQPHKVIYPFGYPYKFVLNHVNQFILNFRK